MRAPSRSAPCSSSATGRRSSRAEGLALASVATLANAIWEPGDCPLCAAGVVLETLA